ncbi:MAG: hypothetical protein JXQ87_10385 [Bacteroidia bacterium]
MFKSIYKGAIFFIVVTLFSFNTNTNDWKLAYNSSDINVYTRNSAEGLSEFKGITTINAPLEQVVALIDNAKNQADFVHGVKRSELIKEITPTQKVVYSEVEMPWPLDNRDIVSKTEASFDKTNKTAIIKMYADPDYVSEKDGLVRMKTARGFWKFTEIGENKTDVTYQFVSDPEGLPAWIVSMFIVDAPKETLLKMKELEDKLKIAKEKVSWIK